MKRAIRAWRRWVRAWRDRRGIEDPSTDLSPLRRQYNAISYHLNIYPEPGPGEERSFLGRLVAASVATIAIAWWLT